MRIFYWQATGQQPEDFAHGYVLAENREQAEEKLKLLPYNNKCERIKLVDKWVGRNGCEIDENGLATRWED